MIYNYNCSLGFYTKKIIEGVNQAYGEEEESVVSCESNKVRKKLSVVKSYM